MGKIILEFDDNEDWINAQIAINANKLQTIIWDFDQRMRANYKYDKGEISVDAAEKVREILREIMEENGITFEHEIFN